MDEVLLIGGSTLLPGVPECVERAVGLRPRHWRPFEAVARGAALFSAGRPAEWRNRLIWGDKKYVLTALLEEFAGQVDLVYIDPPFATGANFSFRVSIEEETFEKEPSIIEQKAYRDTWGRGSDGYAQWLYETLLVLRDLLAETGKLFLHIDNRKVHHARLLLDEEVA